MSETKGVARRRLLSSSIVNVNRLTYQCTKRLTLSLTRIRTAQADLACDRLAGEIARAAR
jgi:hypothetical protein